MQYIQTNTPVERVEPMVKSPKVLSKWLTIRSDEATRRKIADTDGRLRQARQLAESNRLI